MPLTSDPGGLRVVSGGQTGVDRAALDAALAAGLPSGGWCPHGRWAEDGPLDPRYPLTETPLTDPAQRTEWNVRDSDGTLVLLRGPAAGGTARTIEYAERFGKPCLVLDLCRPCKINAVFNWLSANDIRVLNVAGPRESETPGIQAAVFAFFQELFRQVKDRSQKLR